MLPSYDLDENILVVEKKKKMLLESSSFSNNVSHLWIDYVIWTTFKSWDANTCIFSMKMIEVLPNDKR